MLREVLRLVLTSQSNHTTKSDLKFSRHSSFQTGLSAPVLFSSSLALDANTDVFQKKRNVFGVYRFNSTEFTRRDEKTLALVIC